MVTCLQLKGRVPAEEFPDVQAEIIRESLSFPKREVVGLEESSLCFISTNVFILFHSLEIFLASVEITFS